MREEKRRERDRAEILKYKGMIEKNKMFFEKTCDKMIQNVKKEAQRDSANSGVAMAKV